MILSLLFACPQVITEWELRAEIVGTAQAMIYRADWVGDLDQDGFEDLVTSETSKTQVLGKRAYSGLTLLPLFYMADSLSMPLHWSAGVPMPFVDVDADGYPDFLVRALYYSGGSVTLHSGKDGSIMWTVEEPQSDFAIDVEVIPDRNGDGVAELAVGDPGRYSFGTIGCVHVLSGRTGAYLHSFTSGAVADPFGHSVEVLDDLDGDGVEELVTTSANGMDLDLLWSDGSITVLRSRPPQLWAGASLATVDFDRDGKLDIAVAVYDAQFGDEGVVVLGAPSFVPVATLRSALDPYFGGVAIQIVTDLDQDGSPELAVAGRFLPLVENFTDLYSGATWAPLAHFQKEDLSIDGPGVPFFARDSGGDGTPDYLLCALGPWNQSVRAYLGTVRIYTAPRYLQLSVSDLVTGQPVWASIALAEPLAPVGVMGSWRIGLTEVSPGLQLSVAPPMRLLASGQADPGGAWTYQGTLPATAPIGATLFVQGLSFDPQGRPSVSNPVGRVIR